MVQLTTTQLLAWVGAFVWPLARILGLFTTAPVLSDRSFPVSARIGLAVAITVLVLPSLPAPAVRDPISWYGLQILVQQVLIGLAIGFVMRLVFTAIELAGELMGTTMGLGFATLFDPHSQGRTSVISQFMSMIGIMLFLATDLHLLLIDSVIDSFQSLPINRTPLDRNGWEQLVYLGSRIFSTGLQLSMPVITALLIANLALGILTRAAPQLNLFSIGFPVTLLSGYLMLAVTLPYWSRPLLTALQAGMQSVREFTLALAGVS